MYVSPVNVRSQQDKIHAQKNTSNICSLTDDPLAPDWTINWRRLLGKHL